MNSNIKSSDQSRNSAASRVLQLCHAYKAPFAECARQYVELFRDSPYKVTTVFLIGDPDNKVAAEVGGDEVIFLGFDRNDLKGLKLKVMKALHRRIANKEFDFCIAHRSKPTWLACMATKLPIISIHHSFDDYRRFNKRWFLNFFKKRMMLIGVSNAVRDELRSRFPNWPAHRIETIHNRIDYISLAKKQLSQKESRQHLNLAEDAWIFANVGRLHPMKDQATLIKAFARAKPQLKTNSLLVIIGTGSLEDTLRQLVLELNLEDSVCFLNYVNDARHYFKAFDCFVLSSDNEPFGMVLLEAMTANIPVICTASGGAAEVIQGIGKTFTAGSIQQLSDLMVEQQSSDRSHLTKADIYSHLESKFSDEAARKQFWQLPGLKPLINKNL